jgi:hypothetical protein
MKATTSRPTQSGPQRGGKGGGGVALPSCLARKRRCLWSSPLHRQRVSSSPLCQSLPPNAEAQPPTRALPTPPRAAFKRRLPTSLRGHMSDHANSTPVAESAPGDGQLPDVAAEGSDSDNDNAARARPKQAREKADPTLVPKSGNHWQHDMRGVASAPSSRGGGKGRNLFDAGERGGKSSGKTDEKWKHDMFESSSLSGISPAPPRLPFAPTPPFRAACLLLRPPLNPLQKLDLSLPRAKAATPPLPPAPSLQRQLPTPTYQPPPSARLALSRVLAAHPSQLSPRRPPPPASQTPPPSALRMKVGAARYGLPPPFAEHAAASHATPAAPRARTVKGRDVSRAAASAASSGSRGRGGAAASSDRSANVTSGAASARALVAATALNASAAAAHDLASTAMRGRGGAGSAGRGRDDRHSAQRVSEHTYSAGADDGSS